jgi:DNA-binding MarR family transcriptional regulator
LCKRYGEGVTDYPRLQLDRQLCFALYTASRAIVRSYGPLLDGTGLTYPQYITMLALWEDAQRSLTVGELGDRLHLDSGTLTPLLKRLAAMGYVTRSRDPQDERRVLVGLTAEGLRLRDRLASVPQSLFERCRGFGAAEVESLREQLAALTVALESEPLSPR